MTLVLQLFKKQWLQITKELHWFNGEKGELRSAIRFKLCERDTVYMEGERVMFYA